MSPKKFLIIRKSQAKFDELIVDFPPHEEASGQSLPTRRRGNAS